MTNPETLSCPIEKLFYLVPPATNSLYAVPPTEDFVAPKLKKGNTIVSPVVEAIPLIDSTVDLHQELAGTAPELTENKGPEKKNFGWLIIVVVVGVIGGFIVSALVDKSSKKKAVEKK